MTTNRTDLERIVEEGILTPWQAEQLHAAGIENGPELVMTWRNPSERPRLAEAVGSTVKELMPAILVANLLQQKAPGEAGIDLILKHKENTMPTLEDTEDDHEFVTRDRQGMIGFAGYTIHLYESLNNKYGILPTLKFYIIGFGLFLLFLMGAIAYEYWAALSGDFGPDVTSQLAQQLNRREALLWVVISFIIFGMGGLFVVGGLWIKNRLEAWLADVIDRKMGRTPRDVLVEWEVQNRIPRAWEKAEKILNQAMIFIWFTPMFVGIILPGIQIWASWIIFGLLFSWMFLKTVLLSIRFSKIKTWWAQQARPHQAGLMLTKLVATSLVVAAFFLVSITIAGLLSSVTDTWTRAHAQDTRSDLNVWLAQQKLEEADQSNLQQFILEVTDNWLVINQERVKSWADLLPVIIQIVTAGMFAIVFGATLGWYIFIRHKRLFAAVLFLIGTYLAVEIIPDMVSWWLFKMPQRGYASQDIQAGLLAVLGQTFVQNIRGLTIGLFLALGQDVFNNSQDRYLDHECPECYGLLSKQGCGYCGCQRDFEKVLDLS